MTVPACPGSVSPRRLVPSSIVAPAYVRNGEPWDLADPMIKSDSTIAAMRGAGRIAADALVEVGRRVAVGVTTDELDRIGHDFVVAGRRLPVHPGLQGIPEVAVHVG